MVLSRSLQSDTTVHNDPMFAIKNREDIAELKVFCERHEFNIIEETTDRHDKPLFRLKMDRKQKWRPARVALIVLLRADLRDAMLDAIIPHMDKLEDASCPSS